MSPRAADPAVRAALLDTAARLIADEGPSAVTLRRLTREVGTSTMAVYTHFGSMDDLRSEVRREGFARLRAHLGAVERTRDPVADLCVLGWAYYTSATGEPNLYRAMFSEASGDPGGVTSGLDTFEALVAAVARCVEAGRFPRAPSDGADELAVELWALNHGLVSLQLARLLAPAEAVMHLGRVARSLFVAWGDDPEAVTRSMDRAGRWIEDFRPGP